MRNVLCRIVMSAALLAGVLGSQTDPRLEQGPKPEAVGDKAMVATQLPIVTEAALKVLKEGGNAVDAMVTAVFLQHVNDFHQVSHFGAMSAVGYDARSGEYYALNAVSERPRADRGGHGDAGKVAIGGVVRGLEALAERFGTRPWSRYLEPAIRSAEEGVVVTSFMYGVNTGLLEAGDILENKEAREAYMPDGHLVPVGRRWKRPRLAETLRRVAAEGADYLYTGAWGQKFVKAANGKGFRVTIEDMAAYEAKWDAPVRFFYRGHEIFGSPPPDTGGLTVGANLNVLEHFDLKAMGPYSRCPETLEVMARAFGFVGDNTRGAIRDPLAFLIPSSLWLSKDFGKMGAEFVRNTMLRPGVSLKPHAPPSALTEAPAGPLFSSDEGGDDPSLGSNHNVIVDEKGNWISMLHTGHGGAPGIFIDGVRATGSTARALTVGPGRRLVLPITAVLIANDGRPWLAMGTPGLPPQPITEVLVNILDFGMPPKDAADAPRFWAAAGGEPTIRIESRISKEVRQGMAARGFKIQDLGDYNWHTGSVQIVWRDPETGRLHGATDPRRLGLALGY